MACQSSIVIKDYRSSSATRTLGAKSYMSQENMITLIVTFYTILSAINKVSYGCGLYMCLCFSFINRTSIFPHLIIRD